MALASLQCFGCLWVSTDQGDGASLLQAEGKEEDEEWRGWRLLTMAGIFDCWEPPAGGEVLYTYTIITVDASKDVSFIHHRQVRAGREAAERAGGEGGKLRR